MIKEVTQEILDREIQRSKPDRMEGAKEVCTKQGKCLQAKFI